MILTKKKDPKSIKSHAGHLPTKSLKITLKKLFSNAYLTIVANGKRAKGRPFT